MYKRWIQIVFVALEIILFLNMSRCSADYPALDTTSVIGSDCSSTLGSGPSLSGPALLVDTTYLKAPRIIPNGGNFHVSVELKLLTDTLPQGAIIEYSLDKGQTWQPGQQFVLVTGGQVIARVRSGNKVSLNQSASFRLYFERMLIIGNSVMYHPPSPDLGWYNSNGMAASAPEKDFVHLLTDNLETIRKPLLVKLSNGGDFEQKFGAAGYDIAEFAQTIRDFKPDLILVRLGENIDENRVQPYNLEGQFKTLLEGLAATNLPLKIVCTTSVWYRPKADAVIRKVVTEKGYSLVDLSCIVGQGQYFAKQYMHPGVAAHPNDLGMKRIEDLIWEKIQ